MTAIDEARAALAAYDAYSGPLERTSDWNAAAHVATAALRNLVDPDDHTEREALRIAVGRVLFNASNFPERVQARLLGQDMAPLNEKLTVAVLAAGFRRQGPIDDAEIEAARGAQL